MTERRYNAEEVLEIACRIERNGARFYRRAVDLAGSPEVRKLLLRLAEMEDDHERAFEQMRGDEATLSELLAFPEEQAALYLQAVADGYLFPVHEDPSAQITPGMELEQVLRLAIGLEKDSIAFYEGIKLAMPAALGRDKIEAIIHEELMHAALLGARLRMLDEEQGTK